MKFNIIHIIICIFVFVGCTQQTVNNSVECFTIKESGSSLVYCSDTLKSKIQMEIIKGHYTVETKEVFAIVSNPKHLSLGYDSAWNLEKWENSQWIILDKKNILIILQNCLFLLLTTIVLVFLLNIIL